MAELQSLLVNDSASNNFPTASNTTDVGYIWFNDSSSKIEYSGWSGDSIIAKELGNSIPSTSGSAPALYQFTSNTFNNSKATDTDDLNSTNSLLLASRASSILSVKAKVLSFPVI